MSSVTTSGLRSKPFKDEYQNWLAVGYAFDLMNEGIRPFITREMKAIYNTLIGAGLPPCTCHYDKRRKNNPWHDMGVCDWAKALQLYHGTNKPKWHQSDASKWADPLLGSWEIAKLFMSDLGKQKAVVVDATSTDTTGLLNILCWCKNFAPLRHFAEKARDVRNVNWGHNPAFELSLPEKTNAIQTMEQLLNAGALSIDPDAKKALNSIKTINSHFDVQKLERQIIRDYMDEMTNEMTDLQSEVKSLDTEQKNSKKAIKGLEALSNTNNPGPSFTIFVRILVAVVFGNINSIRKNSKMFLWLSMLFLLAVQLDPSSHSLERCPNDDRVLPFNLREFNFSKQLNAAREEFVGRRWLYDDVKHTLRVSHLPILLIIGEPGSGKSAVAANLICSRTSEARIHERIIAYHLCQHYNKETQEPGRFIKNVVDMISKRSSEYKKVILNGTLMEVLQGRNCESDPYKCFIEAIVAPLKKVFTNPNKLYYIVIDALDECIPQQSQHVTIIDLLKDKVNEFPKSIKVIATTRNDSIVVKPFPRSLAKQIHINTSDPRNLDDIAFYIDRNLYPRMTFIERIRSYLTLPFSESVSSTKLSDNLVKISQGNFLFAKLLIKDIKSDSQISSIMPQSLGGVYERYFRRVFPNIDRFRHIRGVLEILVASTKPFKVDEIFKTVRMSNHDLDYTYFSKDLESLSHFLRYSDDNKIALFHKSLMEWLIWDENKSIYVVSKMAGHRKLIFYYMDAIENNQTSDLEEAVFSLAQHVAFSGNFVKEYTERFMRISSKIIQTFTASNSDNSTFLHMAARIDNPEVLKLFLPCFRDSVDPTDANGFTPAFVSASHGFLRNMEVLVAHGANTSHYTNLPPPLPFVSFEDPVTTAKREFWNSSMLHAAAQGGHLKIVKYLLENTSKIDDVNGVGLTALQLAAENGHLEIVKFLHQRGAKIDQFALHHAAMNGHRQVVEFLVTENVTGNCLRCDGFFYWLDGKTRYQSLWFYVAEMLISPLPNDTANLANNSGWNYSLVDDQSLLYCETPLHIAVRKQYTDVARILLRTGSAIHCADFTGRTPLHIAAHHNDLELIKMLIEAGASVDSKCSRFQHQEQTNIFDIRMFLIKNHKHLSQREEFEYFRTTCFCGYTPVHVAAQFGHIESAKLLLQENTKLSTKADCNGSSLIHIAACNGKHQFIQWLVHYKDVNINSPAKNRSTPLHSAAACENVNEAKALIMDGANILALDANGMTIVHYWMLSADVFCTKATIESVPFPLPIKKEIYFLNENINVYISSPDKAIFFLHYADQELKQEIVPIDDNCRNFMELLNYTNDPSLLVVRDKFGRTALHMAINSGLHCVSIVLMRMMPDYVFGEELGYSIWNYILDDLVFKDVECQWRTLKIMFSFFDMFGRKKKDGVSLHAKSSVTLLKLIFRLYLTKGKRVNAIERWFLDMEVPITIDCNVPFLESELHLLSYWPPTNDSDNFFLSTIRESTLEPGPLFEAIIKHPLGIAIINRCRDQEGYTPLHRAAQGGNIVAIKELLSWGADIKAVTRDSNLTALDLAVSFAGLPKNYLEISGFIVFTDDLSLLNLETVLYDAALNASLLLLDRAPNVQVTCDGSAKHLTIYHIAAYRGMFDFVKKLLKSSKRLGVTVDCPDKNGITPLYLAKLSAGKKGPGEEVSTTDKWMKTVKLIEKRGGKLRFPPSLEVEHHVLYRHLFGSYLFDFNADIFNDMLRSYGQDPVNTCYNGKTIQSFSAQDQCVKSLTNLVASVPEIAVLLSKNPKLQAAVKYFKSQAETEISDKALAVYTRLKRNLDQFVGALREIINTVKLDKAVYKIVEKNINECDNMCPWFNQLLEITILYFRNETFFFQKKDNLAFFSTDLERAKFTKFRLKFTPIFDLNIKLRSLRTDDLKTMAIGMRYLLDLVLNKSSKYNYLRKLSIGISPGTRLFYDNTKFENIKSVSTLASKNLQAKLERSVGLQRMLLSNPKKLVALFLRLKRSKACFRLNC